jgi:hypothetical protein
MVRCYNISVGSGYDVSTLRQDTDLFIDAAASPTCPGRDHQRAFVVQYRAACSCEDSLMAVVTWSRGHRIVEIDVIRFHVSLLVVS